MDKKKETRAILAKSVATAAERRGKGRTLEVIDPERATEILERLASGEAMRKLVREGFGDYDTIVALRSRHAEALGKRREVMAQDAMEMAEKARVLQHEKMNQLFENPDMLAKTNLRDLAMTYGIYADKFHMATEGNKVTVEHKSGAPSIDDALKVIEAARAKLKATATEINVTPGGASA